MTLTSGTLFFYNSNKSVCFHSNETKKFAYSEKSFNE